MGYPTWSSWSTCRKTFSHWNWKSVNPALHVLLRRFTHRGENRFNPIGSCSGNEPCNSEEWPCKSAYERRSKHVDLPTAAEINGPSIPSLIICGCEKTPTVQDLQESTIEILFGIPLSEAIMMMVLMSNTRAIMYWQFGTECMQYSTSTGGSRTVHIVKRISEDWQN